MLSTRDPGDCHPFPWGSLDSTTRDEAAALRDVRSWAGSRVDLARAASALGELVGGRVEILVRGALPAFERGAIEGAAGVLVASSGEGPAAGALIEADPVLAATIVARAIRRTPPVLVNVISGPPASVAGALAAVVMAAARRSRGDVLRLVAAGPAPPLASDMARAGARLVAIAFTVLIEDDAFAARVVVGREVTARATAARWSAGALARLGIVSLAIPIVACASSTTVADVAALRPGDVFLPGAWPLARAPGGGWTGRVLLSAPGADVGIAAQLGDGGEVVLIGSVEPLVAAEAEMGEGSDRDALVTAIGEVPVVVRVEIGEARMPARDWAALGRGDVVALGRRVGEKVVLRIGGVPVARGELVEIDGEVGVRIAERLTGKPEGP